MSEKDPQEKPKVRRGFNVMSKERHREIASKGGKAVHEKGTGHQFSSDEAQAAGRKGGLVVSKNREHMSNIGRRGGYARHGRQIDCGDVHEPKTGAIDMPPEASEEK